MSIRRGLTPRPCSPTASTMSDPSAPPVIVSGIQPTGNLHLGNYLGAIRNWVRMQDDVAGTGGKCFFFLADLHAISLYQDPAALARAIREMAAALIAAGVDPARATLFRQRDVAAHSELAWLLQGVARVGWLNRMTQFKDKAGKNREGSSVALYTYPVLQAADVLIYRATHVPVGERTRSSISNWRATSPRSSTRITGPTCSCCPNRSFHRRPRGSCRSATAPPRCPSPILRT